MDAHRHHALQRLQAEAHPLQHDEDIAAAAAAIGGAPLVLLGEATHGSSEFYRWRAALTLHLIREKGFDAVAVEADWPAALRVSRHVQGRGDDGSPLQALEGFERFPRWMWRNREVVSFLESLRQHNERIAPSLRVGFFGLDLYSLGESMHAVLQYLDGVDPEAAARARLRYACFNGMVDDPQAYGHAVNFGLRTDCERDVVMQLRELLGRTQRRLLPPAAEGDELFYAQQNARVVRNAETYYRSMFAGRIESWNIRDRHMAVTLQQLREHLSQRRGRPARVVVWAHNSHVGDARGTDSADEGQLNLGQLVREQQGDEGDSFLLGFTTHVGTVAAASDWDAPVQCRRVLPSRPDSLERLLHDTGLPRLLLPTSRRGGASDALRQALAAVPLLERAIGVIYRPDTERWSHYFAAVPPRQFDAVVHLDETRAVQPLDVAHPWAPTAEPETWPSGI